MDTTIRHTLNIGLNDKDTKQQKYDIITSYKIIEDILQQYTDGYTIYETHGGFRHADKHFVQEKSLTVILYDTSDMMIKILVEEIKQILNQESVAVTLEQVNTRFMW